MTRRSLAQIRNPVLALPSLEQLRAFEPKVLAAIAAVLMDLRADTAARAEHSWKRRKAPMAAYWRSVSVYAGHIARALR